MGTKVVVKKKKKVVKKPASFTGSIVETTEMVPVAELNSYFENPNVGDPEKTAESLSNNGQYRSIVVNRGSQTGRPNEILAGNHTYMGAKKLGWAKIQVDWVDVDHDHGEAIMLADNGSRDGSTYKDDLLADIMNRRKKRVGTLVGTTMTDGMLDGLLKKTSTDKASNNVDSVADAPDQLEGIQNLQDHVFFPSTLEYEIPELDINMIPTEPPKPMKVWAGHELDGKDIIGEEEWEKTWWLSMWHAGSRGINWQHAIPYFYTDDFHFEPIYNDPAKNTKKILNLGISTAFMPNYTIYPAMPTALWVFAAYRSFYVARYFQEAGIKVIPDIQTGMDEAVMDVSLIGIPEGAPVVATQAQMSKGDKTAIRTKARLLKEAEDRIGFEHIIVYGHTDADEVIERANFSANVIKITARTARRREYLNSGSTINSQKVTKRKKKNNG
jgi:flagellar motor protein MotB